MCDEGASGKGEREDVMVEYQSWSPLTDAHRTLNEEDIELDCREQTRLCVCVRAVVVMCGKRGIHIGIN